MPEKTNLRTYWLTVRFNQEEYTRLQHLFQKSKCAGLSAYARAVLLKEPVVIVHRKKSADDMLAVFIALKNELNALGNNFNQEEKKLHTLAGYPDIKVWIMLNEK